MSPFARGLLKGARTVHLYLTLFSISLILFFAITGFMLNHEDWFSPSEPLVRTQTGTIPEKLLEGPDKLGIVELLRAQYGIVGQMDSFDDEEDRLRITFKRPGSRFEITIEKEQGQTEIVHETRGFVGLLLDLHRGKASGNVWSVLLDIVCFALVVIGGTGLYLWWSLKSRGRLGSVMVVGGLVVAVVVIIWFVP